MWSEVIERSQQINGENGYPILHADPPWGLTGLKLDYPVLKDQDFMRSIPLKKLQKIGYMFLWVTNAKLEAALQYLEENDYRRIDLIAWVKVKPNMTLRDCIGYFLRHNFELCIIAATKCNKRKLKEISKYHKAPNVILQDRREQSRKPDEIYQIAETLVPNKYYLDIFGRYFNDFEKWDSVGNEAIFPIVKKNEKQQKGQKVSNKQKKIKSQEDE